MDTVAVSLLDDGRQHEYCEAAAKSPRTLTVDESAQEFHVADVVRGRSAHPDGVHDFLAQPLSELWVFGKHVYGGGQGRRGLQFNRKSALADWNEQRAILEAYRVSAGKEDIDSLVLNDLRICTDNILSIGVPIC